MVATEVAKNAGAITIAYCHDPNADMSKIADYHVPFNTIFNPETKYMESNAAPILKLAFEILAAFDGYEHLNDANAAFDMLQDVVNEVVRYIEPRALRVLPRFAQGRLRLSYRLLAALPWVSAMVSPSAA